MEGLIHWEIDVSSGMVQFTLMNRKHKEVRSRMNKSYQDEFRVPDLSLSQSLWDRVREKKKKKNSV